MLCFFIIVILKRKDGMLRKILISNGIRSKLKFDDRVYADNRSKNNCAIADCKFYKSPFRNSVIRCLGVLWLHLLNVETWAGPIWIEFINRYCFGLIICVICSGCMIWYDILYSANIKANIVVFYELLVNFFPLSEHPGKLWFLIN